VSAEGREGRDERGKGKAEEEEGRRAPI